jgi:excisionase family DNA binding protein
MESPYLTAKEAMAYLRLGSRRALQRMLTEHHLPFCRLGRHYRFDTRDLDAWLRGLPSAVERSRAEHRKS